jgi:hypothetical protein
MPNGSPHDHPLTDILVHSIPVYGDEADTLIRRIAGMCSHRELYEWWEREIGWSGNEYSVVEKARLQVDQLLQRAKEGGWEIQP